MIDLLDGRSGRRPIGRSFDRQVNWSIDRSVGRLICGRSVGRSVGRRIAPTLSLYVHTCRKHEGVTRCQSAEVNASFLTNVRSATARLSLLFPVISSSSAGLLFLIIPPRRYCATTPVLRLTLSRTDFLLIPGDLVCEEILRDLAEVCMCVCCAVYCSCVLAA